MSWIDPSSIIHFFWVFWIYYLLARNLQFSTYTVLLIHRHIRNLFQLSFLNSLNFCPHQLLYIMTSSSTSTSIISLTHIQLSFSHFWILSIWNNMCRHQHISVITHWTLLLPRINPLFYRLYSFLLFLHLIITGSCQLSTFNLHRLNHPLSTSSGASNPLTFKVSAMTLPVLNWSLILQQLCLTLLHRITTLCWPSLTSMFLLNPS